MLNYKVNRKFAVVFVIIFYPTTTLMGKLKLNIILENGSAIFQTNMIRQRFRSRLTKTVCLQHVRRKRMPLRILCDVEWNNPSLDHLVTDSLLEKWGNVWARVYNQKGIFTYLKFPGNIPPLTNGLFYHPVDEYAFFTDKIHFKQWL